MQRKTAETWVNVLAILNWISAFFGILLGVVFLFGGAIAGAVVDQIVADEGIPAGIASTDELKTAVAAVLVGLGVLLILLSVLSVFIGVGLWRRKNWGRILAIISLWVGVVWMLITFFASLFGGNPIEMVFQFVVLVISGGISAFFLWLLHMEPNAVSLFVTKLPPPRKPSRKKKKQ